MNDEHLAAALIALTRHGLGYSRRRQPLSPAHRGPSQEHRKGWGLTYEARMLGVTNEQFDKLAYPEPEPCLGFVRQGKELTAQGLELQKRLKRWNGEGC